MTTIVLTEQLDLTEATADNANRVVKNVVLIRAGMSKNRRFYSEVVLAAAAPLFENAPAFNDHSHWQSVTNLTGHYSNVRYENGAIRADRHFSRTQAGNDVYAVVEDMMAGRAPKTIAGLSISAVGQGKSRKWDDGEGEAVEVESITAANSVDDVINPAAGGTYLAASAGSDLAAKFIEALSFEEWHAAKPDYVKRLMKEWKTTREADSVQAAKAEADANRTALEAAQQTISDLTTAREAALSERDRARRELLVVEALQTVKLPTDWKADLRARLVEADPDTWVALLESEQRKARSAGHHPRVNVSGSGAQEQPATPPELRMAEDVRPRDDEDFMTWLKRVEGARQKRN
jgi:hypothetical protein